MFKASTTEDTHPVRGYANTSAPHTLTPEYRMPVGQTRLEGNSLANQDGQYRGKLPQWKKTVVLVMYGIANLEVHPWTSLFWARHAEQ